MSLPIWRAAGHSNHAGTWRAWATGFGATEDIHGDATVGSARQDNTIYGGSLGVDYQLMPNYLVGIAAGGSSGNFSVPGRTTSGSTDGGHVAFYDLATFGSFYGASSTMGGSCTFRRFKLAHAPIAGTH